MLKAANRKRRCIVLALSALPEGAEGAIAQDLPKYLQYNEQAAEAGNVQAQYRAGVDLLPVEVCQKIMSSCDAKYRNPTSNMSKALFWLNKAAEQKDDTGSLDILATIYGYGLGVPQDGEKAMLYYQDLEKNTRNPITFRNKSRSSKPI